MSNKEIHLTASHFAREGYEKSEGEYCDEDRVFFKAIRSVCPEFRNWGDLPIGIAWGSYSQDVYLISWLDLSPYSISRKEITEFMSYILWHDFLGDPHWGITPEELSSFAKEQSIK